MPGGDRTGPLGEGARSGRGKGLCSGSSEPGYVNDENRRGAVRRAGRGGYGSKPGRGRGFGRR